MNRLAVAATLLALPLSTGTSVAAEVPFDSTRWSIEAEEWRIEEHLGRTSLFLGNGQAILADLSLLDGEIAFDVAFTPERGFCGALFRVRDPANYEHFYLRPHQSGNADANQYTPVFDATSAWQLYHGPSYAAPTVYPFDEWIHVRIVFAGDTADIYIGSDVPTLSVELKRAVEAGSIGLSSFLAEAHFSRFSYRQAERSDLVGEPVPEPPPPPGVVPRWRVSAAFQEASLEGATDLSAADLPELIWKDLQADPTGITNLARRGRDDREADTVLAETTIRARKAGVRHVAFGYSDRVRVFANGRLVYAGNNGYRSRDYRYLGTIGLFDEILVEVRPGDNRLVFAVSEDFGGWGILAAVSETG